MRSTKYIINAIALLSFVFFLESCSENEVVQTGLKGRLIGKITSYSGYDNNLEHSNVNVAVVGTNPEMSVKTDDKGGFIFNDLPTGTYDLVFTKDGYGTHKIIGYSFVGGGEPTYVTSYIYKLSATKIKDFELVQNEYSDKYLDAKAYLDFPGEYQGGTYLRYYLHSNESVSPANYKFTDVTYAYGYEAERIFHIPIDTLKFPRGSNLYAAIYPCSEINLNYIDRNTGLKIYSSVDESNGSEVTTVKIPEK